MSNRRQVIAVIFGGRSVEHDVSIVTGHQVMQAFPADSYQMAPVYIARDGRWYTGQPLADLDSFRDGRARSIWMACCPACCRRIRVIMV